MATFAKSTFNTSLYSLWRPTYPSKLFDFIFDYHKRAADTHWDRAIDLGCGTGQATVHLMSKFRKVIGVDPSESMVHDARQHFDSQFDTNSSNGSVYRFLQGQAEDLRHVIKPDSVDLVISAQAAHWFDYSKVWPETRRILRKDGTVAFWIYSEMRFPQHPSLTPLINHYAQGKDPKTSLGPHFQRPGRTILENHLLDVPNPAEFGFKEVERVFFTGDYYPSLPAEKTLSVLMRREMRWRDYLAYLRTWSSLHTYHELYPEDATREADPRFPEDLSLENSKDPTDTDVRGGDIAVRFWKDLRENAQKDGASVGLNDTILVEWPVALILARKAEDTH